MSSMSFFQETINKLVEGYALSFRPGHEESQHVRIEMHRRRQDRIGTVELAAFGLREIIFAIWDWFDIESVTSRKVQDTAWERLT
jgi:hypothetical protein